MEAPVNKEAYEKFLNHERARLSIKAKNMKIQVALLT
jgi:hypothetical protein